MPTINCWAAASDAAGEGVHGPVVVGHGDRDGDVGVVGVVEEDVVVEDVAGGGGIRDSSPFGRTSLRSR